MKRIIIRKPCAADIMDISLLLLAIWWQVVLFSPASTFEESTYTLIDSTGGLFVWRVTGVLLTTLYVIALILNKYMLKAFAAIITIGALIFMVVAVFRLEPKSAAIGPYIIFLIIAFWRYINIMLVKR